MNFFLQDVLLILTYFVKKKGSTAQTLLNHVDVIIHNKDENIVNLFVRRSFAKHLWEWMEDSSSRL